MKIKWIKISEMGIMVLISFRWLDVVRFLKVEVCFLLFNIILYVDWVGWLNFSLFKWF